jgi:hypothetical protein
MGFARTGRPAPNRPSFLEVLAAKAVADPADRKELDRRRFPSPGQAPIRASSIRPAHPTVVEAEVRNLASFA